MKELIKSWNPVLNLIVQIKKEYEEKFGQVTDYRPVVRLNELNNKYKTTILEYMIEKLEKEKYINWVQPLQFTQYEDLILVRYGLAELQRGMWEDPDSIFRECRSVVINIKNEELVLVPFKKFFNLAEVEENTLKNVIKEMSYAKRVEYTNKLDGSMQFARFYKGKIIMAGSKSMDPNESWRLKDGYDKLTENHKRMIEENSNITFIFEYISLKDAHVVAYKKEQEGLYLIGARNVDTGYEYTYSEIQQFSQKYNVPMAQIENVTFDEILAAAKSVKSYDKEGWVINIISEDNKSKCNKSHKIKIKADDYVQLHRILSGLSSINAIIENIADNKYDDMMSQIPEEYRDRIEKVSQLIFKYRQDTLNEIDRIYNEAPKATKKDFMIYIEKNAPKEIRGYIRNKYYGEKYNILRKDYGKFSHYKTMAEMGLKSDFSTLFSDEDSE